MSQFEKYIKSANAILSTARTGLSPDRFAMRLLGEQLHGQNRTRVAAIINQLIEQDVITIRASEGTIKVFLHPSQRRKALVSVKAKFDDAVIGMESEISTTLYQELKAFVESSPEYDVNEVIQAAIARFLVQKGVQNAKLRELYIADIMNPGAAA